MGFKRHSEKGKEGNKELGLNGEKPGWWLKKQRGSVKVKKKQQSCGLREAAVAIGGSFRQGRVGETGCGFSQQRKKLIGIRQSKHCEGGESLKKGNAVEVQRERFDTNHERKGGEKRKKFLRVIGRSFWGSKRGIRANAIPNFWRKQVVRGI